MASKEKRVSRRRRRHEETVEEILEIAREMMQRDGVAALSFNAIARRLGMRPPSLYTYFDSKNAIYDELFRRGFEAFSQRVREPMLQEGAFPDKIRSAFETYMRFAQENPDLFQLMFQRPVPDFVPSEHSMAISLATLRAGEEQFRRMIESGAAYTDLPPDQAQDLLIALMHGLTEQHMANNPELPVGEGRYGRLIPAAVQLLTSAWTQPHNNNEQGE